MSVVRYDSDDGPKLREELSLTDLYPTINENDMIPIIDDPSHSLTNEDERRFIDIVTKQQYHVQYKQMSVGGKISIETLNLRHFQHAPEDHKLDLAEYRVKPESSEIKKVRHKPSSEQTLSKRPSLYETKIREDRAMIDELGMSQEMLTSLSPYLSDFKILYDMDEQDALYLEQLNQRYTLPTPLLPVHFEAVITILELTWSEFLSHLPIPALPPLPPDQLCSVCNQKETPNNTIVFCDNCNIAVHQECYGIIFIPPGPWFCRPCSQNTFSRALTRPYCALCPETGQWCGPLKQTTCGTWVHVLCAVWIGELCFGNWHYLEPVEGIEKIPASRWKLTCCVCKLKLGACIQCSSKNCFVAYHVSCAKRAGFYMSPLQSGSLAEEALNGKDLKSYCARHSAAFRNDGSAPIDYSMVAEEIRKKFITNSDDDRMTINYRPNFSEDGTQLSSLTEHNTIKRYAVVPHAIAEIIQSVLRHLIINAKDLIYARLGNELCRYWSLKRELGDGLPLISIASTDSRYAYNLLDDSLLEERLNFIDTLLTDVEKLKDLTSLVKKRNVVYVRQQEANRKVADIVQHPEFYVLKNSVLPKLVVYPPFIALKNLVKDTKYFELLEKCSTVDYSECESFKTKLFEGIDELLNSLDFPRLVPSYASKTKDYLSSLLEQVNTAEVRKLLRRDFITNIADPLGVKERQWKGPALMEEEELSEVEDLSRKEARILTSLVTSQVKRKQKWKGTSRRRRRYY